MKTPRILVVDDEPGIRQSLSGILEDEGYHVETAENGEVCRDLLARFLVGADDVDGVAQH